MIRHEEIEITSELSYTGCGLPLTYKIGKKTGFSFLPDVQIMDSLQKSGYITGSRIRSKIVFPREDTFVSMDYFMRCNLDTEMAQKLLAIHLNSRTDKPIAK